MLEAAVPSPNTLPADELMLLLNEALEPKAAPPPNAGELPKEGGLPNTGALPKPPVEGKVYRWLREGLQMEVVGCITTWCLKRQDEKKSSGCSISTKYIKSMWRKLSSHTCLLGWTLWGTTSTFHTWCEPGPIDTQETLWAGWIQLLLCLVVWNALLWNNTLWQLNDSTTLTTLHYNSKPSELGVASRERVDWNFSLATSSMPR